MEFIKKTILNIDNKEITIYSCGKPNHPTIYLNAFTDTEENLIEKLKEHSLREFNLINISHINWNSDLVPWNNPPIFKKGPEYRGNALEYLEFLIKKVIPEVNIVLGENSSWNGLVGYSLGGLFSLYSMYNSNYFTRFGCVSGSLWFPGFIKYAKDHKIESDPVKIYFSIGNREAKVKNVYLNKVQRRTEDLYHYYKSLGIDTIFELNPGNHFNDPTDRVIKALKWLLD